MNSLDSTSNSSKGINSTLFSVILLHYNQQQYINQALDSIFSQNYDNIELIIADDSSNGDLDCIKSYIKQNKTPNIKTVIYHFYEENIGTVRNVNRALRSATGKHIMFFAADDCLYDADVMTNFRKALFELPKEEYMVTAQCDMMDKFLNIDQGTFVNVSKAHAMNEMSATEQFKELSFHCYYSMGASAFKRTMLEEKGYFDETYKIIEDWSYYLHLTLNGSKITFTDFNALKHRAGGVSHFEDFSYVPPHVKEFLNDGLMILEKLVLPNFHLFSFEQQYQLLGIYETRKKKFFKQYAGKSRTGTVTLFKQNYKLYIFRFIRNIKDSQKLIFKKSFLCTTNLFVIWALLAILQSVETTLLSPDKQLWLLRTPVYDWLRLISHIVFLFSLLILVCLMLLIVLFFIQKIKNSLTWRRMK
jgi:glycosyltransferase involved in cell wall biosynthesis